jgi:hypothetical protein
MSARARHLPFDDDEMLPGERIGPPLAGRGKAVLKGGLLLTVVCAVGWGILGDQAWRQWLPTEIAADLSRLTERLGARLQSQAQPTARIAAVPNRSDALAKPAALEPLPSTAVAAAPPIAAPPPLPLAASKAAPPPVAAPESSPLTTGALPPSASAGTPGQPLAPPTVDPSNPYQVRAAAVGLHPDLSAVLLARLSATDYRNAGYAIETALKETSDTAVFVWPRQRKPELALFRVRFVAGAATGCRRYVVTVVKDGWSTTAMPMERCKSEQVSARRR